MSISIKDFNRLPHVPRTSQGFTGQIPLHFEGHPNGPFEGSGINISVPNLEHATLCRAFKLDPVRFYFELPSSMRGVGSSMSGVAGGQNAGRRTQEGYVFMAGRDEPVATLYKLTYGDKLRDMDPLDAREYEAFGYRR